MRYLIKAELELNYLCDLVNNAHCVYCAALTMIFAVPSHLQSWQLDEEL